MTIFSTVFLVPKNKKMRPAYRMISPKDGRSHREFSVDLALLSIRECILVGFVRGPDQKKGKLKKPQERKEGGFITLETKKQQIRRFFSQELEKKLWAEGYSQNKTVGTG